MDGPDGPVTGRVTQRHRMALLALLALPRSTSVSRDQLLGYLWPESDEERARHRLSNSLYLIKKTVGNDAIVEAGDGLRLNPERVRVDVTDFEQAVAAGALEKAVPLYAGPLLDGFLLKNTPEFDRWVEGERDGGPRRCGGGRAGPAVGLVAPKYGV